MSRPATLTPNGPPIPSRSRLRPLTRRPPDPFADSRLMARAGAALLLANVRYWTAVAPLVRAQLSRWERRAQAIPDPLLRTLAASKLRDERFNAEVAATLATLAGPAHRKCVVRAIVALQAMYDYLDLLTEQPLPDPPADGRRLFAALDDALAPERPPPAPARESRGDSEREPRGDYYPRDPRLDDGGYLPALVSAVRLALARLPALEAVADVAQRSVRRCAEAQLASHMAARSETAELERWARREAAGTGLQWPEFLAGAAASVLAVHALIAAAADGRTTARDAAAIDAAYLSICALTMLDSLVDHDSDAGTGQLSYVRHYRSRELMARRLAGLATDAAARARQLPHAPHHVMTVVGVVAYYASAPAAGSAIALPVTRHMRSELRPLIGPTLAVMRAWRLAKRARAKRCFGRRSTELPCASCH